MAMVLEAGENQVVHCVMSLGVVDKCVLVLPTILEVAMKAVVGLVTSLEVVVNCMLVLVMVLEVVVKDVVVLVMVSIDEMSLHHARSSD